MNQRNIFLLLLLPLIVLSFNLQDADALRMSEEYVILSENYFIVFETNEDKRVIPIDGGVLYNDKWVMLNMTEITVEQLNDDGDIGSFIGKLVTGDKFWFTWNIITNSNIITSVWVYDGITVREFTDNDTYMKKLFF